MSVKEINPVPKVNNDTGFSTTGIINGSRFINRDGTFNLHKKGWPFWDRFSIFYTMISLPLWQFIVTIVLFFFSINLAYTGIYWLIGPGQFTGFVTTSPVGIFKELYFFSTETFTTVGYGRVNPIGDAANLVAAIEAMSGFLSLPWQPVLFMGVLPGHAPHLAFGDHALIAPLSR